MDVATERAAIRRVLDDYVGAYNRLDEAAIKAIDPSFKGIPVPRSMLRSVELSVSGVSIDIDADGQSAVLRFTQNFRWDIRRAGFSGPQSAALNWRLQKTAAGWRVIP